MKFLGERSSAHRAAILRGLRRAAALSRTEVVRRTSTLAPYPPVHTGEYRRRWRWEALSDGARLYNEAPYAGIIELGARPGRIPPPRRGAHGGPVPFRSLLRWTYLKFRNREGWKSEGEAWGRAVAIQRALNRRGLAARRVLTAPEFVSRMARITRDEVRRALSGR